MTSPPIRLGILLSGRGSNFRAIVEAIEAGKISGAEVGVVISNKPDAAGLVFAQEKHFPAVVCQTPESVLEALQSNNVDLVILAGYMKILPPEIIRSYPKRILNIHPSLLPAYGGRGLFGMRVHQAVIDAGETQSGCTVHWVTDDVDEGPVVGQRTVTVAADETPETLAAKILTEEHQLYPEVIAQVVQKLAAEKTGVSASC